MPTLQCLMIATGIELIYNKQVLLVPQLRVSSLREVPHNSTFRVTLLSLFLWVCFLPFGCTTVVL
jgi:hypothetical protein